MKTAIYTEGHIKNMHSQREQLAAVRLTRLQALCLAMFCFDGLTQAAIATQLSATQQAVSKLIVKGTAKLRRAGLEPRQLDMDEDPRIRLMSTEKLDAIGWKRIKAVW